MDHSNNRLLHADMFVSWAGGYVLSMRNSSLLRNIRRSAFAYSATSEFNMAAVTKKRSVEHSGSVWNSLVSRVPAEQECDRVNIQKKKVLVLTGHSAIVSNDVTFRRSRIFRTPQWMSHTSCFHGVGERVPKVGGGRREVHMAPLHSCWSGQLRTRLSQVDSI